MFELLERYIFGLYNWFSEKNGRKFTKIGNYWLEVEYYGNGGAWIGMGKGEIFLETVIDKGKIEFVNIVNWEKFKEMFNETKKVVLGFK